MTYEEESVETNFPSEAKGSVFNVTIKSADTVSLYSRNFKELEKFVGQLESVQEPKPDQEPIDKIALVDRSVQSEQGFYIIFLNFSLNTNHNVFATLEKAATKTSQADSNNEVIWFEDAELNGYVYLKSPSCDDAGAQRDRIPSSRSIGKSSLNSYQALKLDSKIFFFLGENLAEKAERCINSQKRSAMKMSQSMSAISPQNDTFFSRTKQRFASLRSSKSLFQIKSDDDEDNKKRKWCSIL